MTQLPNELYRQGFVAGWNSARDSVEDLIDISESSEFAEPMQANAPVSANSIPRINHSIEKAKEIWKILYTKKHYEEICRHWGVEN